MEQTLLDQAIFADNPEPRCPVVMLLDTSYSMQGEPISQLNNGLRAFSDALKADTLASLRVEVAIISFGGSVQAIDVHEDSGKVIPFDAKVAFITVDSFEPPVLSVNGNTPMGEAVRQGLKLLQQRKEIYKENSLDYFRPWIFLITDGYPTDEWPSASNEIKEEEARKGVIFFGVGVQDADMKILAHFSNERQPLQLEGLAFQELFTWLSKSLSAVAHSKPGEEATLPPLDWAQHNTSQ